MIGSVGIQAQNTKLSKPPVEVLSSILVLLVVSVMTDLVRRTSGLYDI
jgi:hypothetical protein